LRKFGVSVVEQVPFAQQKSVKRIRQLSSTLLHEGGRGMRRDARNLHAPRRQFHHDEHIVRHQAVPRRHFHREEVGCGEHLPMHLQKLPPAHARLAALRGGLQVMATEDITHRNLVDGMPQICQGALNAAIAPARILLGHLDREAFDLLGHGWPTTLGAARAPVKLLGDQSLVPAQEGVRRGDRRDLFEALTTERIGERREAAALGVGEPQPSATKLGFEDTVFLLEIGNNLLLVTLEPPGDHGDQNVEDHSAPQVGVGDGIVCSSIHQT
jgi:hypothetical protein